MSINHVGPVYKVILKKIDRVLLSACLQQVAEEISSGDLKPIPPCKDIADFEAWRISIIGRIISEPLGENEVLESEIPYNDLSSEQMSYIKKLDKSKIQNYATNEDSYI